MLRAKIFLFAAVSISASICAGDLGVFEAATDVGSPGKPGNVAFDAAKSTYKISGGGANMWFTNDALHFVWKKVSGDGSLAAEFLIPPSEGGDPRGKAVLMIRQTLDKDSAYADAALHGDGLPSLQYRETQ